MAEELKFEPKDIEDNKGIAVLSYVWILFLVPLLSKKESKFAQANAKQGMVLFVAELICAIIPVVGWILGVVALVFAIIAIVNTLEGKYWKIPVLHDLSQKFNF